MLFKMFHWEPEGHYRHRLCTAIAPLWFSIEHLLTTLTPFLIFVAFLCLSTDDMPKELIINYFIFSTGKFQLVQNQVDKTIQQKLIRV